jgi:ABC-type nitrate/sulfonate/bicarbonate transport system substrate-binding protein
VLGIILLLQSLTIAVSGPPTSPEYLPLRLAAAEGYFADAGLAVTLRSTRADAGAAEALAQQQVDLAATSVEAALRFGAARTGEAPRIVFGLTTAPPVVLAVPASFGPTTRSVADLAGSVVGISSPGAPEQTWFQALLSRAALRVAQVSLTSYGERPLAGALASGQVRAGLIGDPPASRLLADGSVTALVDFRDPQASRQALGRPTVHAAVFESAGHRVPDGQVEAVSRALLRAVARLETASADDVAERLPRQAVGLPDDFAVRLAGSRKIYLPQGLVEPAALAATIDIVRAHVPLPRALRVPPIAELLRLGPLRHVLTPAGAR